jgi:hypothetical protein
MVNICLRQLKEVRELSLTCFCLSLYLIGCVPGVKVWCVDVHHGPCDILLVYTCNEQHRYIVVECAATSASGNPYMKFGLRTASTIPERNVLLLNYSLNPSPPTATSLMLNALHYQSSPGDPKRATVNAFHHWSLDHLKTQTIGKSLTASPTTTIQLCSITGTRVQPNIDHLAALLRTFKFSTTLDMAIFPNSKLTCCPLEELGSLVRAEWAFDPSVVSWFDQSLRE